MSNTETNRIENKEQLNEDFEQEVIAFLNYKEGGIIYVGVRKDGQVVGLKDVDLIENIGSGVLRILDAYDKSCFKFMDHFLRVSFKYRENPFEYDDTAKVKSSKLGSKKSSKLAVSEKQILELCKTAKSLKEIAQHFGYKDVYKFKNNYMNSLLEQNKLQMTIPDKPKSRNQKYVSKS